MRNALLALITVWTAGVIESHPTSADVGGSVQSGVASYYWQRQRASLRAGGSNRTP
jgi:hypothetical protein